MKKILNIFILLFVLATFNAQAQNAGCCPKFSLIADFQPCDTTCKQSPHNGNGTATGNPTNGQPASGMIACKNQTHRYFVVPNLPGYSFNWTVIGGSLFANGVNPATITWGNGTQGFLQVIITSADKKCIDTIKMQFCLVDGPTAGFTFSPSPVCAGGTVCFNSSASIGATNFYWDFGDGTSSTLPNPCHIFVGTGPKIVVLTVSGTTVNPNGESKDCGCKDTAMKVVFVDAKKGIDIHTDDCRKMLCSGDTVKYCTSNTSCTSLVWSADGGNVINGQGTTCVTIVWNSPGVYPTAVKLSANCPGTCGNNATLQVPVLFPAIPVSGPAIVCPGSVATYTLPALPGTFYHWTIGGGGNIINYDSNHNVINVQWNNITGGPFIISCNYNNPYSGCSGTGTISVTIKPKFQITGPSNVCTVVPAFFSVAGGGNANWNLIPTTGYTPPGVPPGTFSSTSNINLTWSATGGYTINAAPVTPANYCTPSASLNVIVNQTPVLNPIAGPTVVCPNQLYNYSASSNVLTGNYIWNFISGTGTVAPYGPNNSLASVNFTGSGPWILQAMQTANGCSGFITLPITAVPPPPPIPAIASTCSGGSVTVTLPGLVPPGGYTWSATPGAVLVGTPTGLTATFVINSNATITVSNCAGISSANVSVNAIPVTITQTPGSCVATLTATAGAASYAWFLNGNPVGSGNPKVVTQNGTYVLQATYAGGCIAIAQVIITGITPVVATISATGNLCNGGAVTLQAPIPANCPGATFTWSNGAIGNPITVNAPGAYFVTVNCSNGCTAKSNTLVVQPCIPAPPGCINDLVISPSNCPNPVALTTNIPAGCTPVSTAWSYGDGTVGTTGNHLYANVGAYTVYASMTCVNGTIHCGKQNITVPMVDSFTNVISCGTNAWTIQLQDASMYLPAYAGYSITWGTSCGSLSAINIPNPVLTVSFSCNPTVTLTISKNGCALVKSFTFNFPATALSINGPATVCKGVINSFSSSYTTGVLAYAWNFGDGTTGVTNPINHAYNGTPSNPTITMIITDQYNCHFTTTKPIVVNIPTPLTITPSPIVKICPDCLPPAILSTNPAGSFSGYQWYHNGVAVPAATNPTYQLCTFNASGNYYVTAISTNNNCPVTSDTVKVIYNPKPLADIIGQTVQCVSGAAPYNLFLQNSGGANPNYAYNWTVTGPGTVVFSPNNLQSYASVTVSQLGSYQFILTVTDITTKCVARDTFCVFAYLSPSVTVTAPTQMCAGTMYTMTANATPTNPNYIYQWSNGATTQSITTSLAGNYSVTVLDPVSGCLSGAFAGTIKKTPYTDLFPLGCDTLCDTAKIIPPLPLAPGQNYNSVYEIKWYVDGNLVFTGPFLNLVGLGLGQHVIHIVVKDLLTGCISTSGDYNLFIKHCGDCDCKESHWGEIDLTKGEPIDHKNNENQNVIIDKLKLECKGSYELKCNQTYTVTASYNCKDKSCPPKTTYSLQPPTGAPITGTNGITFTPTINGVYILTIYGWCGGKICDSCLIRFKVTCVPDCDCKGSKWGEKTYTINNVTKPIDCTNPKPIEVKCKTAISINANYFCAAEKCNSAVTYSLQQPSGTTTGTVPLNFTPTQAGSYTVTLYGWCGNKICDSCVIKFVVRVCDEPCCPYDIKVDTSTIKYDYTQIPNATVVSENYSINGLAMANITEVRANVVSYVITDNFGKECLKCVNLPFTWASIASATNMGVALPKITMYGGTTVPLFNGSGTGAYQNPREVIWKNSPIVIPNGTNVGISFIVPPVPAIDCCELKGRICVKFTFRDNDCRECEVIQCFEFLIRKK